MNKPLASDTPAEPFRARLSLPRLGERGAAVVEFSLFAMFLFMLTMGIIDAASIHRTGLTPIFH